MNLQSTELKKTVSYKKPIIKRTEIGSKPHHHFDQNPGKTEDKVILTKETLYSGAHKVWADVPVKQADGNPVMVETQETLDLRPRSPWLHGVTGGLIGGLVGAGVGAFFSSSLGMSTGEAAGLGALAMGAVTGGLGAASVYGEKTKLVWDQHQIIDHKMTGYREFVGPGSKGETQGHFHRYIADIESTNIGSYKTPRVLRYKGDVAPEKVVEDPGPETPDEKIPKEPGKELDVTVTYETERLQSRYLGSIPHDYWSYSPFGGGYTSCGTRGCNSGGRGIWRNTPVYEPNEAPRVDTVTERIQAKPYSVPLFAAGGLVGGGLIGLGLGALIGHWTGMPTDVTAAVGAGAVGLVGAFSAADYASNDRVRLEWREYGIHEKRLAGYTEYVTPHYETRCETYTDSDGESHTECETYQDGWDHSFTPDVRRWSVGSYVSPVVVHYQKVDGEFKPVKEKGKKPNDEGDKAEAA